MKIIFLLMIFLCLSGCSMNNSATNNDTNHPSPSKSDLSVSTWNTQTFFDGVTTGTEYYEFQKAKNWNEGKYKIRLERLTQVMEAINADVFVFQEIENENVMQDISNMLAGNSWNKKRLWTYAAFAKHKGDAIGCGIFSRFPITNVKTHSLDIRQNGNKQPPLRPLVQVTVSVDGRELVIFINHWKSKSGGEVESEPWRRWQEGVLANSINHLPKGKNFIAVGDFNRDIEDFSSFDKWKSNKIALKTVFSKSEKAIVSSPWITSQGKIDKNKGSYFYKNNWSRIDNIFYSPNIMISDFSPLAEEPWCDINGVPLKYLYYTGEGYSDHLPLFCNITLSQEEKDIP